MGLSQMVALSAKHASVRRRWGQRGQSPAWQEEQLIGKASSSAEVWCRGLREDRGSRDEREGIWEANRGWIPEWRGLRDEGERWRLSLSNEASALLAGVFSWGKEAAHTSHSQVTQIPLCLGSPLA